MAATPIQTVELLLTLDMPTAAELAERSRVELEIAVAAEIYCGFGLRGVIGLGLSIIRWNSPGNQ